MLAAVLREHLLEIITNTPITGRKKYTTCSGSDNPLR